MKKTVLLVVIVFVVALVGSVGVLLFTSPDFSGFGSEPPSKPVVTYLSSDGEEETGAAE